MIEKIKTKYYITENIKIDINKFIGKNPLLLSRFINHRHFSCKSEKYELPTISFLDSGTPKLSQRPLQNPDSLRQEQKSIDSTSQSLKLSTRVQIRNELKTVKQEITIMENLKNLTQSCFDMS
jgi:hypothetical protein